MASAKSVLLNHLLANTNNRSWYVSFQESVEGFTEEDEIGSQIQRVIVLQKLYSTLFIGIQLGKNVMNNLSVHVLKPIEKNEDTFIPPTNTSLMIDVHKIRIFK